MTITSSDLEQFTGTNEWHKDPSGLLFTDGIKFLIEQTNIPWLVSFINGAQRIWQAEDMLEDFQFWRIQYKEGTGMLKLTCERDTDDVFSTTVFYLSDFPLEEVLIYCSNNVVYLPSEH